MYFIKNIKKISKILLLTFFSSIQVNSFRIFRKKTVFILIIYNISMFLKKMGPYSYNEMFDTDRTTCFGYFGLKKKCLLCPTRKF